jgi:hypothetical protein
MGQDLDKKENGLGDNVGKIVRKRPYSENVKDFRGGGGGGIFLNRDLSVR